LKAQAELNEAGEKFNEGCEDLYNDLRGYVEQKYADLQAVKDASQRDYLDRQECLDVADQKYNFCMQIAGLGAAATVAVATWLTGGLAAVAASAASTGGGTVGYCSITRGQDHNRCIALYPDPNAAKQPDELQQLRRRRNKDFGLNPQSSPSPQSGLPAFSGAPTAPSR
jgi:hypothetical protein